MKTLDTITHHQVIDTIRIASKDEVVDLYKTILEQQTANYNTFLVVLLTAVAGTFAATWWWNKSGANRYINKKIEEKFVSPETKQLITTAIDKRLEEQRSQINKELENVKHRISGVELDAYRSIAGLLTSQKKHSYAIFYSALAAKMAMQIDDGQLMRAFANVIIDNITDAGESKFVHCLDDVSSIIDKLPETLFEEKRKIQAFLKEAKSL